MDTNSLMPLDLSSMSPDDLARTLYDSRMTAETTIPSEEEPLFNDHDRSSASWEKMRRYLWRQLFVLRELNDAPKTELDTATLRGRIMEIKNLLELACKQQQEGASTPDPGY